jgi:muconolactone D-isomerase
MEFMVHITNNFPVDGDKTLLAQLTKDERAKAKELSDQGILRKLWRRTGKRANVGIWKTDDANQLHAALSSLPFFPWLEIEVWPLTEHPNDPNRI